MAVLIALSVVTIVIAAEIICDKLREIIRLLTIIQQDLGWMHDQQKYRNQK